MREIVFICSNCGKFISGKTATYHAYDNIFCSLNCRDVVMNLYTYEIKKYNYDNYENYEVLSNFDIIRNRWIKIKYCLIDMWTFPIRFTYKI